MAIYRQTRNWEASFVDYITALIAADWGGTINVIRGLSRVYDLNTPIIAVRIEDTRHPRTGIGELSTSRSVTVFIDIFATGEAQKMDLKDYLISKLKHGIPYYEYEVTGETVNSKVRNGNITLDEDILDTPINFGTNVNTLDDHDKNRHLLTLVCSNQEVEE